MSEANKIPRPLPRPNIYMLTQPLWEAAKAHRFLVQYDTETDQPQWPPRPVSIGSGKRTLEWREVSGRGKLYSWTLSHVAWPGHAERTPYMCALVDLDEGVRVLANLVNHEGVELRDGLPVKLSWETLSDAFEYFNFEPA